MTALASGSAVPTTVAEPPKPARPGVRLVRRNAWNAGLVLLFVALLAYQAAHTRAWGSFELQTLFTSTLPLVFLAVSQTMVVIGGGIDLSVGAQLVLFNCVSAALMKDVGFAQSLGIVALTLLLGVVLGIVTGWVVSVSGIPDIIVTLATSFIWLGLALVVMPSPGGGANSTFRTAVNGSGSNYWPALLVLAVPIALLWLPVRRSRAGLSVYALGSNPVAAFLAGVNARRARTISYALGGFFAALAGLATTAFTGGGQAASTVGSVATLSSVAATVLGGVALTGGVGGVAGPVIAVWCLFLVPADLLILGVDPSYGQVVNGVILVLVVLIGSVLRRRWSRA